MNIIEGLQQEMNRVRELKKGYEDIGAAGQFGLLFIKEGIERAERAIAQGDVVEMVRSYHELQEMK